MAVTLTDGTTSLTDNNGPDAGGEFVDGEKVLILGRTDNTFEAVIAEGFDFVTVFDLEDDTVGSESGTVGVIGIGTNLADMPTQGSVTYLGRTNVVMSNINGGSNFAVLSDGDSVVEVDFLNSMVDVEIINNGPFTTSGDLMGQPMDILLVEGMVIDGNAFSGGEITMFLNGEVINPVGLNADEAANGHFFGFDDANQIPDEVGGTIISADGTSAVVATFVAD